MPQTTIVSVTDDTGAEVVDVETPEQPAKVLDPGAAAIVTDILAGNTDPSENPFWGKFRIMDGGKRRPATLKTGTNNDAQGPQRLRLHRRPRTRPSGRTASTPSRSARGTATPTTR